MGDIKFTHSRVVRLTSAMQSIMLAIRERGPGRAEDLWVWLRAKDRTLGRITLSTAIKRCTVNGLIEEVPTRSTPWVDWERLRLTEQGEAVLSLSDNWKPIRGGAAVSVSLKQIHAAVQQGKEAQKQ